MFPFIRILLFCSLVFVLSCPAQAQDEADEAVVQEALPELVVTATAEPLPQSEVPVPVQVISEEEIQRTGAETLGEVLAWKTPIHLYKMPGSTGIGIRGFRTKGFGGEPDIENKVLVLIDGNRAGTGNVAIIPVQNVERIEVVRGPGSVLYGGSAMGGVVNVITKRGSGDPEARVGLEAGNFGFQKLRASASGGLADDRLGFSIAGRVMDRDDYHIGEGGGKLENTAFESNTLSGSVAMELAPGNELRLVANQHDANDVGQPGMTFSPSETEYLNEEHTYVALSYDMLPNPQGISLHLAGYNTAHDYEYVSPGTKNLTETETTGVRARVGVPITQWGRLLIGSEYAHVDSSHSGSVSAPDSEYEISAAFAEQRFELKRLDLFFGARYDYYSEKILDTQGISVTEGEQDFDHFSWRGGAVYDVTDWLAVRGAVGTGFRPPVANELAGEYDSGWKIFRGNEDLDAETSTTYEAGIDLTTSWFQAGATLFHTESDDTIVTQVVSPGVESYTNLDGLTLTGIEGTAGLNFPVQVSGKDFLISPYLNWITYLNRENEDKETVRDLGTDVPYYIPKTSITAGILFRLEEFISLETGLSYTGRQKEKNFRGSGPDVLDKDPFTIWFAHARMTPWEPLSLFLHVDNLTDEHYSYVDGYPMPGRSVTGGIEYRF
ncbi:MAG: TonB-dependent receptor plug domain-containing protein [Desulfovibrionales bacterium]